MQKIIVALLIGFVVCVRADGQTNDTHSNADSQSNLATLVCIRHGEKPPGGLGQLTCRGLNRALALPDVLLAKYGRPQFVFAPNPTQKVDGDKFYYVRPLATIEPTAIRCGLPVNAKFGYREIEGLISELQEPIYENATIFIVWEHLFLADFARALVKHYGGDPTQVPDWPEDDFDTIFVFKIAKDAGRKALAFTIDHEGLNNMSDTCPGPVKTVPAYSQAQRHGDQGIAAAGEHNAPEGSVYVADGGIGQAIAVVVAGNRVPAGAAQK
jgi:hypothetical protein